jgi:hypothetical protein
MTMSAIGATILRKASYYVDPAASQTLSLQEKMRTWVVEPQAGRGRDRPGPHSRHRHRGPLTSGTAEAFGSTTVSRCPARWGRGQRRVRTGW